MAVELVRTTTDCVTLHLKSILPTTGDHYATVVHDNCSLALPRAKRPVVTPRHHVSFMAKSSRGP